MKFIPLGLQCSVPQGLKMATLRKCAYPFDWLWTPGKTAYDIMNILINNGVDSALEYTTTGYEYYEYLQNERFGLVNETTEYQMNKTSGLGINHYKIDNEYKIKLKRRLERLINDIKSDDKLIFIYADCASPELNYKLDDVEYGCDASEYLIQLYSLLSPFNKDIEILYFCWEERKREDGIIKYIPFEKQRHWTNVSSIIRNYFWDKREIYIFPPRK